MCLNNPLSYYNNSLSCRATLFLIVPEWLCFSFTFLHALVLSRVPPATTIAVTLVPLHTFAFLFVQFGSPLASIDVT